MRVWILKYSAKKLTSQAQHIYTKYNFTKRFINLFIISPYFYSLIPISTSPPLWANRRLNFIFLCGWVRPWKLWVEVTWVVSELEDLTAWHDIVQNFFLPWWSWKHVLRGSLCQSVAPDYNKQSLLPPLTEFVVWVKKKKKPLRFWSTLLIQYNPAYSDW